MKTRNGFVSNSSSSSFVIAGKWLGEKELPDNIDLEELKEKGVYYYEADDDGPCIGSDIDIMDDETWGQYKIRVAKILTEAGIEVKPHEVCICSGTFWC